MIPATFGWDGGEGIFRRGEGRPGSAGGIGGGIGGGAAIRTNASYTNFVITNSEVIVPVYGKKEDDAAKEILRDQFPDRGVVGLFAGLLAENGGEFHCVTQQEPIA